MKTWFALLPITAILLGGAVGCESEYDQNARTNTGENRLGDDNDDLTGDAAVEGRMGDTRRDLGADMGTARDDAGIGAEAGADTDRPAAGMGTGTGTGAAGTGTGAAGTGTPAAGTGAAASQREMTGTLEVQDETSRTFQLDGDGATYVAPSTADLDQLDGEEVTITLDANGRVTAVTAADDKDS